MNSREFRVYLSKARSEMWAYQLNIDDSHRCFGKKVEDGDVEKALAKAAKKLVKVAHLDACFSKPSFKFQGTWLVFCRICCLKNIVQTVVKMIEMNAWIGWNSWICLFCFAGKRRWRTREGTSYQGAIPKGNGGCKAKNQNSSWLCFRQGVRTPWYPYTSFFFHLCKNPILTL